MTRAIRSLVLLLAAVAAALPAAVGAADWPTYHGDNGRSGVNATDPTYSSAQKAWSTTLDSAQYASPLVVGSTVVAATENNSVYAFSTAGALRWRTNLGTPVPGGNLPCGNVSPVGITSTPVADPGTNTVFAVGLINGPNGIYYRLAGLDIGSGAIKWSIALTDSAQGFDPSIENQRGALTLANGNIYVPFGGRAGDCGNYYGWVMSFPEAGTGNLTSVHLPEGSDHEGGLWQPAGASTDSSGNLYYASGNTSCGSACTYDYGESVIKFSPGLAILDEFHPSNWVTLNAGDTDLGSTGPVQLSGGAVFQAGKAGDGYVLSQASLGGSGHTTPLFSAHVCPNQTADAVFGGDAFDGSQIYVPCTDGVVALGYDPAAHNFSFHWQASGIYDPPIVAGGYVWVDANGSLYGLDRNSGQVAFQVGLGASSSHFGTPAAANDQLFVPAGSTLVAVNASPQGWHLLPGSGHDVASGGGQVFVLGVNSTSDGYGLWRWTPGGWSPFPGYGATLAVDSAGNPWIVNNSNQIWRWDGANWILEPGSAHYVAAGDDGSVYVLGTNANADGNGVWQWTGAGWAPFPGFLVDLAAGIDSTLWGVNSSQAIYRHPPGASWGQVAGSAVDVTAHGLNSAWAVGTNAVGGGDGVWSFNGGGWDPLPGGVVDLASTSSGVLWGINSSQQIYYFG